MTDQIAQTVVAAVTAAPLEPRHAGRQVQFVVRDQDGFDAVCCKNRMIAATG